MVLQYIRTRTNYNTITRQTHTGEHGAAISTNFDFEGQDATAFNMVDRHCGYPDILGSYINERDSILRILHTEKETVVIRTFRVYDVITGRKSDAPYSHAYLMKGDSRHIFLQNLAPAFDGDNFLPYSKFAENEAVCEGYVQKMLTESEAQISSCAFRALGFAEELFCHLIDALLLAMDGGKKVAVVLPNESPLAVSESLILAIYSILPPEVRMRLNIISGWVKRPDDDFTLFFPLGLDKKECDVLSSSGLEVIDLISKKAKIETSSKFSQFMWENLDNFGHVRELYGSFDVCASSLDLYTTMDGLLELHTLCSSEDEAADTRKITLLTKLFAGQLSKSKKAMKLLEAALSRLSRRVVHDQILLDALFAIMAKERSANEDFVSLSSAITAMISVAFRKDALPAKYLQGLAMLITKKPKLDYSALCDAIEGELHSERQWEFLLFLADSGRESSEVANRAVKKIIATIDDRDNAHRNLLLTGFLPQLQRRLPEKASYITLINELDNSDANVSKLSKKILATHVVKLIVASEHEKIDKANLLLELLNESPTKFTLTKHWLLHLIIGVFGVYNDTARAIYEVAIRALAEKGLSIDVLDVVAMKEIVDAPDFMVYRKHMLKNFAEAEQKKCDPFGSRARCEFLISQLAAGI